MSINELVVSKLIKKGYKISFAESCTGGLAASRIIDVSDASKVLNESYITYSNEAKSKILNVKKETLDEFGAVSKEVALAMAQGLYKVTSSDVCISITGIAGPKGGTTLKPVGLVCFCIYFKGNSYYFSNVFENLGRRYIREESVTFILNKLFEII